MNTRRFVRFACTALNLSLVACGSDNPEALFSSFNAGGAAGSDPDSGVEGGAAGEDNGGAGAGSSGAAGSGANDAGACATLAFIFPTDGSALDDTDDSDSECSNGLTATVRIATSAEDGEQAELTVAGNVVGTATAASGEFAFAGVLFPFAGNIEVEVTSGAQACSETINVGATCVGVPSCEVTVPQITDTHPVLNGVAAEDGGDRSSADGFTYGTSVEVVTSAEDGQLVILSVDGRDNAAVATVDNGVAVFSSVQLAPDGEHEIVAHCRSQTGFTGDSNALSVDVDTDGPSFTVLSLSNSQHFGPDEDSDPNTAQTEIDVCISTAALDALDLPSTLGDRQSNFCVNIDGAGANCSPATTGGDDNACVRIDCPGDEPFDVGLTLTDLAGNVVEQVRTNLTCADNDPVVNITSLASGTEEDVATHLLAATSAQQLRDQDANTEGAQFTIVVCTDAESGSATLSVGLDGDDLTTLGEPVTLEPATLDDNCDAGQERVARFEAVTLPESDEAIDGTLQAMTALMVSVTDQTTETGESEILTLWVDSVEPALAIVSSTRCGDEVNSPSATLALPFSFQSSYNVDVDFTPAIGDPLELVFNTLGNGNTASNNLTLAQGENTLVASNIEPSGNTNALESPCTITLADVPDVEWVSPADDATFNMESDGDGNAAGWQGDLTVSVGNLVDLTGVEVEFFADEVSLGTADASTGTATLAGATIPDGDAVVITARTNDTTKGIGERSLRQSGSTDILVDTVAPDAAAALALSVLNRRNTSFTFSWNAPADSDGDAVVSYDVRVHTALIDEANFDDAEVDEVSFIGNPADPGEEDSVVITNRLIERDYFAAVRAIDEAGNIGPVLGTEVAAAAHFNVSMITAPTSGEGLGISLDGSLSLNGDGRSDLIVGTSFGQKAYVWYAPASGDAAYSGDPDVTFTGSGFAFGGGVVAAGDLNDDSFQDVAISDLTAVGYSGEAYVFYGNGGTWPAAINASAADVTLGTNGSGDFSGTPFIGSWLTRLGDFNLDGVDDLGVGMIFYGGSEGGIAVLRGSTTLTGDVVMPSAVGVGGGKSVTVIVGDDPTDNGLLGSPFLGLGPYYAGQGNGLVASTWQGDTYQALAFAGQDGTAGEILATDADDLFTASPADSVYGRSMALVGRFSDNPAIAVGAPSASASYGHGKAFLYFGNSDDGLFSNVVTLQNSNSSLAELDRFGWILIGSAIQGSSTQGSFLGSSAPDLVVGGFTENGAVPNLYFLEGEHTRTRTDGIGQTLDVATEADAMLDLTAADLADDDLDFSNWVGTAEGGGTPIGDVNGDGFMDLAIGEYDPQFVPSFDGRVIIIW